MYKGVLMIAFMELKHLECRGKQKTSCIMSLAVLYCETFILDLNFIKLKLLKHGC